MKDTGLLFLRLGLGIIMAFHGWPKILGGRDMWDGLGKTVSLLSTDLTPVAWGISTTVVWGFAAALSEFAGGILTALGYYQRVAAFFLLVTMSMAVTMHVFKGDVFDVYSHALALAFVFLSLTMTGAGKFSLDGKIRKVP